MSINEVLNVKNLRKVFVIKGLLKKEKREVLKNVSFSVGREVFGFIGPNGAGKSTTIKIILGFIKPSGGDVYVFGSNIECVKSRVGFLPERPFIYTSLKAKDYLDFCCDAFSIPYFERKKIIFELLELVDLVGVEDRFIGSFSKGMVQRLLFASTLIGNPDLLILDEPMSGLDPLGRSIIARVISDLKKKGKTVFYSSHIIQDVERLSDRVAIIVNGQIKLCDSVSSLISKYLKGYTILYKISGRLASVEVSVENFWKEMDKLKRDKVEIISVEPLRLSLEDIFVRLVRGDSLEKIGRSV
ncbi:ABC transporter ATP-binding protein [Desulfurobacterium sp.]